MTDKSALRDWLNEAARVVASVDEGELEQAIRSLAETRSRGGTIYVVGNGGSASTASHMALDLQKAARADGRGTRSLCLSDSLGLITAWANDADFSRVFSEQLAVLARPGDALVLISVSGSSPNLVEAARWAASNDLVTVGFLGKDGGRLRGMVQHPVVVASDDYGWVESAHLVLEHVVTNALRMDPPRT